MFLGYWDWASGQIELTDDNEYLITFEKKKPWDVRWRCSLSSWLEWKSLRASLVDLNTSYWILVWQPNDFQRSLRESFCDCFNEFGRTVWHWSNLTEGGQILSPNLLRSRKHCSVFQISEYQAISEYSHSLQSRYVPLSSFWIQLFWERLSDKVHAITPKGILGGFEFTVFQRNLKEWLERPWTYVCEC